MLHAVLDPAAGGCSWHSKPTGDPTVIPAARLQKLIRDDQIRMAGVDSARHLRHTYLGVDVTDENPFQATGHIVGGLTLRVYHLATGDTPLKSAVRMEDARSADARRGWDDELIQNRFARKDPYTKRYAQIAGYDSESIVRGSAVRALNYSRSRDGSDLFVKSLDAPEAYVRLEAAKALANIPVEKAVPKLVGLLEKDEDRDVRIACADALRNYKTLDVGSRAIGVMTDRDFGVTWQARQSLILMTGRDFKYDEAGWLQYLSQGSKAFI